MTITTGDVFIPEIWSREAIRAAEASLVLANRVTRYDDDVADGGDVVHIPNISNLSANDKAVNTQVTLQAPTETKIDLTINKHKETSVLVEDNLSKKAIYSLMAEYSAKAGYAITKQIDTDLAGLYAGLSQSVGDGSTAVGDTNIIRAVQYLDDADSPDNDRYFVIKPAGKADLLAIDKFVRFDATGRTNGPIDNGRFGEIYGLQVFVTTQIVTATGVPNVVHHLAFHKEAFALAIQQAARMQTQYKQEYLGTLVTVDTMYGFVERRDTFGVDFRASE